MVVSAGERVCENAGRARIYTHTANRSSVGRLAGGSAGERNVTPATREGGGFSLSGVSSAADALAGPTGSEPGVGSCGRPVRHRSVVEMAEAAVRRVCRKAFDFDWDAFMESDPVWELVESVRRKAVRQEQSAGRDVRLGDIPTNTVLHVVTDLLERWDGKPGLRPSLAGFRDEQAKRGEKGRETQQVLAEQRAAQVQALVASGISNDAEIGRRLGMDRSTVGRIRRKVDEAPPAVLQEPVPVPPPFPAPEIPRGERWPAVQFMKQTGVVLDADQAQWLMDMGRCCEAEGREDDLMAAIGSSAGEGVRDPWAYLQRCVSNRGDAWTVSSQLLADVLSWAGQKSLEYALTAIGGSYVRRPLPYLREILAEAVSSGRRPTGWPERPVAMAVRMARQWAPELVIVAADDAVASEDADRRTGHLDAFRRWLGRLPWEPEPAVDPAVVDAADCCVGLNEVTGDETNLLDLITKKKESSPGTCKADATLLLTARLDLRMGPSSPLGPSNGRVPSRPPSRSDELEQAPKTADTGDSGGIRCPESYGEALKSGGMTWDPLPRQNRTGILEHGPCRHPLAALMATAMVLDDVVEVECTAGCGHRLYSDRGPVECPCHWPAAKVAQVDRVLQRCR